MGTRKGPQADRRTSMTHAERRAKHLERVRKRLKPHPTLSFSEKPLANALGRNYYCKRCGMYHLSEPRRKEKP